MFSPRAKKPSPRYVTGAGSFMTTCPSPMTKADDQLRYQELGRKRSRNHPGLGLSEHKGSGVERALAALKLGLFDFADRVRAGSCVTKIAVPSVSTLFPCC